MPSLTVLNNQQSPPLPRRPISGAGGPINDPERARLAAEISELLQGRGEIRFGVHDRLLYSTDASLYQVEPLGVVVPASIDDAAAVVAWCGQKGVAMLPRGGGTSLAGQCTNRALVIDLTPSCRAVLGVDVASRTCHVEPGIGIDELNDQLAQRGTGLFFAPDPATTRQCAIGGAIGNNAAGARSILYGRTSENIEKIEIMLATGERLWLGPNAGRDNATARRLGREVLRIVGANAKRIRERFPRTVRRNAGYGLDMILDQLEAGATPETVDLAKLLCGSEGTLAMTLTAVLKLHPVPKAKGLALLAFPSVDEAIAATVEILKTKPSAVELLDDVVLTAARGNEQCRRYLDIMPTLDGHDAAALLYVEYFGFGDSSEKAGTEIKEKFADLRRTFPNLPDNWFVPCTDAASMAKAWALRKAGEPLLHGLAGSRKPITFVEDNAVPVERLSEFVREFRQIVAKHGTTAAYWAHASVGVLHIRPMIDIHDPADRERMRAIAVEAADLARRCGGIMSGEHGDGRVRGPLLERFFGPELMLAFQEVKALFDPAGLLNPGNIVAPGPIESITSNLRVDAEGGGEGIKASRHQGVEEKVQTYFDYADTDGFTHAVEQCNGAGVCRKRGGVMCPSYQATLDERHSTRGRGNALRLAITGQFPAGGKGDEHAPNFHDEETIKTLDLCLSCKGCKSECPSNVDIARLKAEYTAQRYRQTGAPLRAKFFGHVRVLNILGSRTPRLANFINRQRPAKWLLERFLDISPRRSVPAFAKSLYAQARRDPIVRKAMSTTTGPKVVLFADCFTTFNDPHIGLATLRVLAALGYRLDILPGPMGASSSGCCGRAMISTGLLDDAITTIDATLAALAGAIRDPSCVAIVACEPSCLSAMTDDWLQLKLATPIQLRRALAVKARLAEDFVSSSWDNHPNRQAAEAALARARRGKDAPSVLLHAHCHQKSLWGAQTSAALLKRLVGDRLRILDTGCCGMAGSFGYTTSRYDLSMRIGELALLPAVREAPPDAVIVAPGTSCRHQIHDGAQRDAIHPMQLAEQLLVQEMI